MAPNPNSLADKLEGIIERLEEARSEALMIRDGGDLDLESASLDAESDDAFESMDSVLLEVESRVDAVTQVMGEEIENLRSLLVSIEEETE